MAVHLPYSSCTESGDPERHFRRMQHCGSKAYIYPTVQAAPVRASLIRNLQSENPNGIKDACLDLYKQSVGMITSSIAMQNPHPSVLSPHRADSPDTSGNSASEVLASSCLPRWEGSSQGSWESSKSRLSVLLSQMSLPFFLQKQPDHRQQCNHEWHTYLNAHPGHLPTGERCFTLGFDT